MMRSITLILLLSSLGLGGARPGHSFLHRHKYKRTLTPDNTCGNVAAGNGNGYICDGSNPWGGECCSQYGYCGNSLAYCGAGCQVEFGICNDQERVSFSSIATPDSGPLRITFASIASASATFLSVVSRTYSAASVTASNQAAFGTTTTSSSISSSSSTTTSYPSNTGSTTAASSVLTTTSSAIASTISPTSPTSTTSRTTTTSSSTTTSTSTMTSSSISSTSSTSSANSIIASPIVSATPGESYVSPPAAQAGCVWVVAGAGNFTHTLTFDFTELSDFPSDNLTISNYEIEAGTAPYSQSYRPEHVGISEGTLQLKVPGGQNTSPIHGAEVQTNVQDILYGSVRTTVQVSEVPGTCHGLFYYRDDNQESDIEILTADLASGVHYTNQPTTMGQQSTTATQPLPVNATEVMHEYRLDWLPGKTVYYLDGVEQQTLTSNVPDSPGSWLWNNWSNGDSEWSAGPPDDDSVLKIQNIVMYFNRTGSAGTCI